MVAVALGMISVAESVQRRSVNVQDISTDSNIIPMPACLSRFKVGYLGVRRFNLNKVPCKNMRPDLFVWILVAERLSAPFVASGRSC